MSNHSKNEKELNSIASVPASETIYNTEKGYFDYLTNIKSQDFDDCDFCAAFMTF